MTINRGIVGALISGPWVSASFRRIATRDAMIWGTDTDIGLGEGYQASHIPPGTVTVTRNTASIRARRGVGLGFAETKPAIPGSPRTLRRQTSPVRSHWPVRLHIGADVGLGENPGLCRPERQHANLFPDGHITNAEQLDLQPDRRSFVDRRSPIESRSSSDRVSAPLRRSWPDRRPALIRTCQNRSVLTAFACESVR